jgi:hypothetical protein
MAVGWTLAAATPIAKPGIITAIDPEEIHLQLLRLKYNPRFLGNINAVSNGTAHK